MRWIFRSAVALSLAASTMVVTAPVAGSPAAAAPAPQAAAALRFVPRLAAPPARGASIDVFAVSARGLAGYELVATVEESRATFVGADSRSPQTERAGFRDLSISGQGSTTVLAAYSPSGSSLSGLVRLGTLYLDSLQHLDFLQRRGVTVRVSAVRFVNSDGSNQPGAAGRDLLVAVGRGVVTAAATAVPWHLSDRQVQPGRFPLRADPELELAWQDVRLSRDPCGADGRLADVTGDGCLDVGDLVVSSQAGGGQQPTTQTPVALAAGTVFVVNSTSDASDSNIGDGACRTSGGVCSLRAAMQEANAAAGPNEINFAIPGSGVRTIQLGSRLPALNDDSGGTVVDGYSQPEAVPNTASASQNARIRIEIRGNGATSFDALAITSAENTIRGLAIYNARRQVWIYGSGATGNRVVGCFVGTNASGTFVTPSIQLEAMGIKVEQDAADNKIGGPSPADRNVVSGNGRQGIALFHNGTDRTVVQNNIVGLSPDGSRRLPNRKHGVDINFGASETQVGGTGPGERNVISGNDDTGIEISHTSRTANNVISGNYIGSTLWGTNASANTANSNLGIALEDGVTGNIIESNVIVNNAKGGVIILSGSNGPSTANVIRHNRIGVGVNGTDLGNTWFGVTVNGPRNTVGPGNTIQFNDGAGVKVDQTEAVGNRITQNVIVNNQGLPIDLRPTGGTVNLNDPGDSDTGANTKLNYPEPFVARNGQLSGKACGGCLVEIFRTGTSTGHGPAKAYVGTAKADAYGDFMFATNAASGTAFSAVAIDASGNTSEMAPNATMQP